MQKRLRGSGTAIHLHVSVLARAVFLTGLIGAFAIPAPSTAATVAPDVAQTIRHKGDARVVIVLDQDTSATRAEIKQAVTASGGTLVRSLSHAPVMAVRARPATITALRQLAAVQRIAVEGTFRPAALKTAPEDSGSTPPPDPPAPDWHLTKTNVRTAWNNGQRGAGQVVAVLDTAIDARESHWGGRIIHEACFTQLQCPNGTAKQVGAGAARYTAPNFNHGSYVTDMIVGPTAGIAPSARVIFIRVFTNEGGAPVAYYTDVLAAMEYVYSLRSSYSIAAVNGSLGGALTATNTACDELLQVVLKAPFAQVVGLLRSAGTASVFAAGNDQSSDRLAAPGCASGVVSVGATVPEDAIAPFSNSNVQLDILAPGDSILAYGGGGRQTRVSGTSFAAPIAAAGIALVAQRRPLASVEERLEALQVTGTTIVDQRNGVTTPRIDLGQAVKSIALQPAWGPPLTAPHLRAVSMQVERGSAFGYDVTTYCVGGTSEYAFGIGFTTVFGLACDARRVARTTVPGLKPLLVQRGFFNLAAKRYFEQGPYLEPSA